MCAGGNRHTHQSAIDLQHFRRLAVHFGVPKRIPTFADHDDARLRRGELNADVLMIFSGELDILKNNRCARLNRRNRFESGPWRARVDERVIARGQFECEPRGIGDRTGIETGARGGADIGMGLVVAENDKIFIFECDREKLAELGEELDIGFVAHEVARGEQVQQLA